MSLTWAQVKTWRASDLDIYVGKVGVRLDVVDRQTEALQQLTLSSQRRRSNFRCTTQSSGESSLAAQEF